MLFTVKYILQRKKICWVKLMVECKEHKYRKLRLNLNGFVFFYQVISSRVNKRFFPIISLTKPQ